MRSLFSQLSYRFYFIFLFLGFGGLIAVLTSLINYNLDVRSIQAELADKANHELMRKRQELTSFVTLLERTVFSLRDSKALKNYIRHPNETNRATVNQLFYSISNTNPSLMQVRYLDGKGMERIRIDWVVGKQTPDIIAAEDLQDKSHRYYFFESAQVAANKFWYSRLDLNVERKKIENPYKPVIRIASPVYVDQQFSGIVLVNVHAKEFLENFKESATFNIALADQDGQYLTHYLDDLSWSRYLQTGHTLQDDYPNTVTSILHGTPGSTMELMDSVYVASLSDLLVKDQAHLLLFPKEQAILGMKAERRKAMFMVIGTILLLSIPLSIAISRIPTKLNEKISRQNKKLQEYVNIIDQNIVTATTDARGSIREVSSAFARVSGYSKDELIGKKPGMLRHPEVRGVKKGAILQKIQAEQVWKGEFCNKTKAGDSYWLEATIFPKFDKAKEGAGYTAICHDVTDKKRIEQLSITDALTGLYNRRFFDETIKKEMGRAMRDDKQLAFAMLDIDYFKQYNDHYGHQKGDEVLRAVGQLLQQTLTRSRDFCFRLGGEEFGLLFSGLTPEEALDFTENVRARIAGLALEHQWGCEDKIITASFGLLSITPAPGTTVDTVYQRADQALYRAKSDGRNRVFSDLLNQQTV